MSEGKSTDTFLELFMPHYRRIFAYILTIVPNWNDAEDIMQETSRVLWEKFDQFQLGTDFMAWALVTARFQAMNYRKKRRKPISLPDDVIQLLNEDYQTCDRESEPIDTLRACVASLKDSDQKYLHMRFHDELKPKKVATCLGVSVKNLYRKEANLMAQLLRCIRRRQHQEAWS